MLNFHNPFNGGRRDLFGDSLDQRNKFNFSGVNFCPAILISI